jgi:hypothetical protein
VIDGLVVELSPEVASSQPSPLDLRISALQRAAVLDIITLLLEQIKTGRPANLAHSLLGFGNSQPQQQQQPYRSRLFQRLIVAVLNALYSISSPAIVLGELY